jgi:hypothetical protein
MIKNRYISTLLNFTDKQIKMVSLKLKMIMEIY